jgi:hypothetical protein
MAKFVFTDAYLTINGVDLSDHVAEVTLNHSAEMKDVTAMGDSTHVRLGGLKDWSLDVSFRQDFAAASVDATLFPLVGTTFAIELRPTSGAVSSTNPKYTGTGILESYSPLGGSVGDEAGAAVTIQAAGDLSRATS